MGECLFWYRPTRVVPDQRPLNGRSVTVIAGLSGRLVSSPERDVTGPRFESQSGQLYFITTDAATYSLGHGLRTFTAVHRLTQPSNLQGMVK